MQVQIWQKCAKGSDNVTGGHTSSEQADNGPDCTRELLNYQIFLGGGPQTPTVRRAYSIPHPLLGQSLAGHILTKYIFANSDSYCIC